MNLPNISSFLPRFGEYVEAAMARAKPGTGPVSDLAILELDCVAYALRVTTENIAMRRLPPTIAGIIEASSALSDVPFMVRLKLHPETRVLLENMLLALATDFKEMNNRG